MRSSAKSVLSTRASACASSIADLRAGERMLAGLEDQPLVGPDRLVARIALDLDEADGDALLAPPGARAFWVHAGAAIVIALVAASSAALQAL